MKKIVQIRRQCRLSWLEAAFLRNRARSLMFDMAGVNVQKQFVEECFAVMRLQAENSQVALPEPWFEDHSWTKGGYESRGAVALLHHLHAPVFGACLGIAKRGGPRA